MPDWLKSMQRTYEYYVVDPGTWKDVKPINTIKKSSISWDSTTETRGSATIDIDNSLGECYVRIYLVTVQNGVQERRPLGTFLVQTPSSSYDGMTRSVSMDAYTPLLELKENPPPLGYSLLKGDNIMEAAYRIVRENARAPVVKPECSDTLSYDFVSNTDDTWISFTSDLITNAKFTFDLDELGRILFVPNRDIASMQPVWTYDDDNSSILYPDMTLKHDLYGVPNVVEVVYSNGSTHYESRVVNDNPNSPISTVSRGREIVHRVTNPNMSGEPSKTQLEEYARQLLRNLSSIEYTVTYSHGYCPVRVGDCVRLNYKRSGLTDVKAKVISQGIDCTPECRVTETAVFTKNLWGGV